MADRTEFWNGIARLQAANVRLTVQVLPNDRVELLVEPTDNLVALAFRVAQQGYGLSWDGNKIRVVPKASDALDTQVVDEYGRFLIDGTDKVTVEARAVADEAGMSEDELMALPGSGVEGRILKSDVVDHLETLT